MVVGVVVCVECGEELIVVLLVVDVVSWCGWGQ